MNTRVSGPRAFVVHHGATILVLVTLGIIAYWGHHTGWKASKFSQLWGGEAAKKEDWCEAHNVPDSKCLACHPELGGGDPKDWCKEHGVPESKCTVCHPEILTKGKAADWCKEHGVPESQCTLCHPEIAIKGQLPPSENASAVVLDPTAQPMPNPLTCQTHAIRIQFASAEAVRKAGVKLEAVQERPMAASLMGSGEVEYDQTRVARLSARVAGTVWRVEKQLGQQVSKGEVLALVDSAEVGRAKSEFLQMLSLAEVKSKVLLRLRSSAEESTRLVDLKSGTLDRLKDLVKEGLKTQTELREAEGALVEARIQVLKAQAEIQEGEAALRDARVRLLSAQLTLNNLGLPIRIEELDGMSEEKLVERVRFLGLPAEIAKTLDSSTTTANLIPLIAPLDGVVVTREIVAGEPVDTSKTLFVVADVRRMWVMLDLRQEDSSSVALGQTVVFRPDGGNDSASTGTVTWISTAVDEKTRTVKARAEVENPESRLRAHTFGAGRIVIHQSPNVVAVPSEAIHWEGCCHVVFVRLSDEVFQTRKVRLGAKSGAFTEIVVGVLPGEVVATTGSHVLMSDLLKSKLGAGCTDD